MIYKNIKNDVGYYVPLFNELGFKSYVTPRLLGDIKMDYHSYLLEPTSEKDLSSSFFSRHVVFYVNNKPYYLNGTSAEQKKDSLDLEIGLLYQKVTRHNKMHEIEVVTFVPKDDLVETNKITYKNTSMVKQKLQVVVATPIYARSADNLRDHRHVTSLLNEIEVIQNGVIVNPTLSFDERGHKVNQKKYGIGVYSKALEVKAYHPSLMDYIGSGSMMFPQSYNESYQVGTILKGQEALGGVEFVTIEVLPNESVELFLNLGITDSKKMLIKTLQKYDNAAIFQREFDIMRNHFDLETNQLQFNFESDKRSNQLSFIPIQPILRRFMGNSYLPHHDYGKGGRGWRDLWQDLIAMIMFADKNVRALLLNNFAGIRIDGSNATIIGDKPGEFIADRNNIVRVWSDHGAWPLLTTKMYIDETGDTGFLYKKMPYFDDQFTHYTKKRKTNISENNKLQVERKTYEGTVLEHLLLENLVAASNVGKKGFIRIEDADWNDGLDMANEQGETIAFTHFYANNLRVLSKIIEETASETVEIFESLSLLLLDKNYSLSQFFDDVSNFNGEVVFVDKNKIIKGLNKKSKLMIKHMTQFGINENGSLQSYIDNDGNLLDSIDQVSLTGQAMALLNRTVSIKQARKIAKATKKHLYDKQIGGYRLNSNYNEIKMNMGRAYGFAYGTKENGAVFSHMSMMYAYGLYEYDLVNEGKKAYKTLLNQANNVDSRVIAGIPEYFNNEGIGKYLYLTGSATWLLKLIRTQVFGVKFNLGKLTIEPKLSKEDFIDGIAVIKTCVFGKLRTITYHNFKSLDFGKYKIIEMKSNGVSIKNNMTSLDGDLEVYLDENL